MPIIELPAQCDRNAAIAIIPEMRDALSASAVPVDASAVERIGIAMLQLLVSFARTAGGIALIDPSPKFDEAVRLAGLESELKVGETA